MTTQFNSFCKLDLFCKFVLYNNKYFYSVHHGHFPNVPAVHDVVVGVRVLDDHQVDRVREGAEVEGDHEGHGTRKRGPLDGMVHRQLCLHDHLSLSAHNHFEGESIVT